MLSESTCAASCVALAASDPRSLLRRIGVAPREIKRQQLATAGRNARGVSLYDDVLPSAAVCDGCSIDFYLQAGPDTYTVDSHIRTGRRSGPALHPDLILATDAYCKGLGKATARALSLSRAQFADAPRALARREVDDSTIG